tara:strand:+ start:554 stop:1261 length:708 start_codon:yes stop_codon:yes gene_type:complete
MDIEDFQRRLKEKIYDTDFNMQRMKYGGADPMLELGVRMDPHMQVIPSILKPHARRTVTAVNVSPGAAKDWFGKESGSAPEIYAKTNDPPLSVPELYEDLSNKGLLAESIKSVEDLEAYPQYPMDKGFIGHIDRKLPIQAWNHELRHEGLEALGYNLPHVIEEVLTRMYDAEYGTERRKKDARLYIEKIAKDNEMSVEELMKYMKRNVPSRFARDTDALRMIDQLKKKFRERNRQ